jgi:signal transduction histidine kinase
MNSPITNTSAIAGLLEQSNTAVGTDLPLARQLAEEALARSAETSLEYAQALSLIGMCLFYEGKYQEALSSLLKAISLYANDEDKWLILAYYNLGICYHQLNLFTEATEAHQKQYNLAEKFANTGYMASALRRMGADHDRLGYPLRALEYYDRSLALYIGMGESGGMAGVYNNMSLAHYQLGNYEQALFYAQKGLPLFEKAGHFNGLGQIHGNLALALSALSKSEKALIHAEKSFDFAQRSGRHSSITLAYLRYAKIYRKMNELERGMDSLAKALEMAETSEDPHMRLEVHEEIYHYHEKLGNFEKAFYHYQQYHQLRVQQLEEAMRSRFENLSIVYRTQQAQAEAERLRQLREQDRLYFETLNQMKDELMSMASHDLKNPLSNIMTVLHLLKRHGRINDERGKDLVERIENSAKQMRELITNLLDLARLETGKSLVLQEQDIVAFAIEVAREYQLLAENQGLRFVFESSLERQMIRFDKMLMQQVFANLLSNALKFTLPGGRVELSLVQEANALLITVGDNGIGIPKEALAHVFERFYMVKDNNRSSEGTGLGLAICKAIVEQHGGSIGVESTEGKGSMFWVRLPLENDTKRPSDFLNGLLV